MHTLYTKKIIHVYHQKNINEITIFNNLKKNVFLIVIILSIGCNNKKMKYLRKVNKVVFIEKK